MVVGLGTSGNYFGWFKWMALFKYKAMIQNYDNDP